MTTPTLVAPSESTRLFDLPYATELDQAVEVECECQDVERCPVHFGYDD